MRNFIANLCCRVGRWLFSFGMDFARYPSALNMPASEYRKYAKEQHDLEAWNAQDRKPSTVVGPDDVKYPDTVQGRLAQHQAARARYWAAQRAARTG